MAMGAFLFVDDHKEREMINGKYSYRIRPRNETEVERFRAFLERHGALAGIMFTNLVHEHDTKYSFFDFVKYGTIASLPIISVTLFALTFSVS